MSLTHSIHLYRLRLASTLCATHTHHSQLRSDPVFNIIVKLISIIGIILFTSLLGHAGNSMTCRVSRPVNEGCTPYLVLEYADITISTKDRFELQGRYDACYHNEEITIRGIAKRSSYHGSLGVEFLATDIQVYGNFPRTIGTVTLNEKSLAGYFFDVWATIRSRGSFHPDPNSRVVRCTVSDSSDKK